MRWHVNAGRKCIIIVPTTSLVEQLYADFEDYSSANGWSTSKHCQKLYSGFSKEFSKDILITTWQSVYLQPRAWFKQFNVIIGDEAHQFKAKSLTTVMEKMDNIRYRIGTGTLAGYGRRVMKSSTKSCHMTCRCESLEPERAVKRCWRKRVLASQLLRDLALPTEYRLCDGCCRDAGSIPEPRTDSMR